LRLHRTILLCAALTGLLSFSPARAATTADAPLADAVERQDAGAVRALLGQNADVNAAQVDGMTALHWATWLDDAATARKLVKAGANVEVKNRYGVTPLSMACANGNIDLVRLFLMKGADPNTPLRGGETPLMTAARTGRLDPVKALIEHGADVNAKEAKDQTALMWAANEGHADVVDALLEAGADFQTPLRSGHTPLTFAVRQGATGVVRRLLQAGADVNEPMRVENRPAKGAVNNTSPLILAVENGHFDLALELLYAGADPNDARTGYTPLQVLTWIRKPSRGDNEAGDPTPPSSGALTSLTFVRELVRHGADVNFQKKSGVGGRGRVAKKGATAFWMASVTGDLPYMKLLIELGADPTLPNAEHATPLMVAAGLGAGSSADEAGTKEEALEAVKFLLELGSDVNAVDRNGETAMHGAAYRSMPEVVKHLNERGADINVWNRKNRWGWTPLLIAQGHRPGNFKPSYPTVDALSAVMLSHGVTPPPAPKRKEEIGYQER
jgi:ankyrin repeat protein